MFGYLYRLHVYMYVAYAYVRAHTTRCVCNLMYLPQQAQAEIIAFVCGDQPGFYGKNYSESVMPSVCTCNEQTAGDLRVRCFVGRERLRFGHPKVLACNINRKRWLSLVLPISRAHACTHTAFPTCKTPRVHAVGWLYRPMKTTTTPGRCCLHAAGYISVVGRTGHAVAGSCAVFSTAGEAASEKKFKVEQLIQGDNPHSSPATHHENLLHRCKRGWRK